MEADELNAEVEDAEFTCEVNAHRPVPTRKWAHVPIEKCREYISMQAQTDPSSMSIHTICEGHLGFCMVNHITLFNPMNRFVIFYCYHFSFSDF